MEIDVDCLVYRDRCENRYDCLVYKLKITLYGVKSKCIIRKGSLNTPTLICREMGGW